MSGRKEVALHEIHKYINTTEDENSLFWLFMV
jgi:hypothetical protein